MEMKIPLQNGMFALVDEEDYENVNRYTWSISEKNTSFGVSSFIEGQTVLLQNFILEGAISRSYQTVFVDGDRLNFKKNNLKIEPIKIAAFRRRAQRNSSSKYKGVFWNTKAQKWQAGIKIDGKRKHLGFFKNEDQAGIAYNHAVIENFGEGYFLNEIGADNRAEHVGKINSESSLRRKEKKTSSKYRGVYKHYTKWQAKIRINNNVIYLGTFLSEKEAAQAYDKKANELYNDKAILNFPKENMK